MPSAGPIARSFERRLLRPSVSIEASAIDERRASGSHVVRNALWLVLAQAIVTPVSILVNAIAARSLGAVDFGQLFLATAIASFALIFVEWGQAGALTGKVAVDRARAGQLLGSGIAWRVMTGALVLIVVPVGLLLLGYERDLIVVVILAMTVALLVTVASACQDVFRGFERTDFAATTYVAWQLLIAAVSVPVLLMGGGIEMFLGAQVACAAIGALVVLRMLPAMRVPKLSVQWATIKELFATGRGFFAFALILALQPMIDAAMLSHFGSPESMGWFGAARKLVGILVYPASALVVALYPTLCRLHNENPSLFRRTAADAFHLCTLAVMPVALGCALFPQIGITIFSESEYAPAEANLRVLAIYLFLVYFSMPIGTCLTSIGKQSLWALVQFACVIVSVVCDPVLIPWFQAKTGNGGLGVCVAIVLSEILMVAVGLYLIPKGILDAALGRRLGLSLLAGVAMAIAALTLGAFDVNVFVSATLSVLAYALVLLALRAVDLSELKALVGSLRRSA